MSETATEVKDVYIIADNILSPLGGTTEQNFEALKQGRSSVQIHHNAAISANPVAASLFQPNESFLADAEQYTKYEQLLIASLQEALQHCDLNITNPDTILIICSTKGNISLLETEPHTEALNQRMALHTSAKLVADYFGFVNIPIVVSNACISGVLGILNGMRLLQSGKYKQAVVTGADVISKFVVSGFQSFQALSAERCKPFDKDRTGLNLGEGAGTVILSTKGQSPANIRVTGGATSNDANHISGPSRTGQELGFAITQAIKGAGIKPADIGLISAHGTATPYNDEMEANAIAIAEVTRSPLFSLKPNYGHTLGAAGLIETVAAVRCLQENIILPSLNFNELGVSRKLNVTTALQHTPVKHALKTASGFGGCNAALVLSK
ncbi:beta-ketoacyl synthase N-terminal-like domain-containing protein [Mucilaginibacter koreensis]